MSTLKIKTVDEVAIELNSKRLPASGAIHPREIRDAFVADRAAIHTSLVAAVDGLKKKESPLHDAHQFYQVKDYNQALSDTLTIINSIFKE